MASRETVEHHRFTCWGRGKLLSNPMLGVAFVLCSWAPRIPDFGAELRTARPYSTILPEDRTNRLSHATGASSHFLESCCRGLVMVGHTGHAGACPDRSGGEAGLRVLC